MSVATRIALALGVAGVAGGVSAQDRPSPSSLIDGLSKCLTIAADAERLACHDTAARRLVEANQRREVVVVDKEEMKKTRRTLFGFTLPRIGLFGSKGPDDGEEVTRLEGPIKRASRGAYGKWTFVMDDGAIWNTTEPWTASVEPSSGTVLTIKKGALGGYMATIPGGRPVRVMRTG
jgi:hypothetical protein